MKGIITFILLGIFAIFVLASCSSQKRLQTRIEKQVNKENIGFVIKKYPEYFKTQDTNIHDTTIIERVIEVPTIDTSIILSDSSNFYHYRSDSLTVTIDKLTKRLTFNIKPRVIYLHDTITVSIPCPQIICPDCDDLKDYTKDKNGFKWWWVILGGVLLGAFYIWSERNVNN